LLYPNTIILFIDKQLIKEGLTKRWERRDNHFPAGKSSDIYKKGVREVWQFRNGKLWKKK